MAIPRLGSGTPRFRQRVQIIVGIITMVGLLLPAIPTGAVYSGEQTGVHQYSNVGVVFANQTSKHNDTTNGGPPEIIEGDFCNGVLIAPDLVLTAGSCLNDPWDETAWFSPVAEFTPLYDWGDRDDNGDYLPFFEDLLPYEGGDFCAQPCFEGKVIKASSSGVGGHDLAVIDLEVDLFEELQIVPAPLPAYNSLNNLLNKTVTTVGYGDFGCAGDACPPDADLFFDEDEDGNPIPPYLPSEWLESSVIEGRYIYDIERRTAVMKVIPESGDWPKNGNKYLELGETEGEYPCGDAGGPYFLDKKVTNPGGIIVPAGTLVAINFDNDCSPVTDVLRLDSPNAKNFLCSKRFSQLKASPLCGGSRMSMLAADVGTAGGSLSADRPQQGKHKANTGKHRGKGHRGR